MLTYFDDMNVQNEEKIFDMSVDKVDLQPKNIYHLWFRMTDNIKYKLLWFNMW